MKIFYYFFKIFITNFTICSIILFFLSFYLDDLHFFSAVTIAISASLGSTFGGALVENMFKKR